MDTHVQPALAVSAPERARTLQGLLDEHGAEMDRRRELTPEVVDALAGQDLLRLLLPRSLGGQEIDLLDYCKTAEAIAWADASTAGSSTSPTSRRLRPPPPCRTRRLPPFSTVLAQASPGAPGTATALPSGWTAATG